MRARMIDLFLRAPWNELYGFFTKGQPPLVFQLLLLNTVIFALFMARRLRGARAMRHETAVTVQSLLILANALIMFRDDLGITRF